MEIDFQNYSKYDFSDIIEKSKQLSFKLYNYLKLNGKYFFEVDFISSKKIHEINKNYRNKDKVTDVITFAFNDDKKNTSIINNKNFLGCIFINYQRAKKQSVLYNHSFEREMCFLFIHGLLHLLGYDHINKSDEIIMFNIQKEIFKGEKL